MSELEKCQNLKSVRTWKVSKLGKCQNTESVQTWKVSKLGKCQNLESVRAWKVLNPGKFVWAGVLGFCRAQYSNTFPLWHFWCFPQVYCELNLKVSPIFPPWYIRIKETTFERRDKCLYLSFFPFFVRCCPRGFKQGKAERVQALKTQTTRPRRQLFLI